MRSIYSRRPTSTSARTPPTAGRTVQRGCEPKAIDPLHGEQEDDSSALDIGRIQSGFNDGAHWGRSVKGETALFAAQVGRGFRSKRPPGAAQAEHDRQPDRA